jgi:hypothetical protein
VPAGTGATPDGTFRWVATTEVELEPGSSYVVGAYWSANNPDMILALGENVVFDSRVSLVAGRAINTLGLAYPALSAAAELSVNWSGRAVGASEIQLRDAALVAGGVAVLRNVTGTVRLESGRLGRPGPAAFVPEPGTLWQLGPGLGLLALLAGRRPTKISRP